MTPGEIQTQEPDQLEILLRRDCSEYISLLEVTSAHLYRGIDGKPDLFKGYPRDNRDNLHTSPVHTNIINQLLKIAGMEANRNNSLFVTSDLDDAGSYGELYYIFPINGFKYTWTSAYDLIGSQILRKVRQSESNWKDKTEELLKILHPMNTKIEAAIEAGNEILLLGSYYALRRSVYKSKVKEMFPTVWDAG